MNRYDEITGKLGAIGIDIAKLSAKFATAPAEDLEALTDKLMKLEDKKKGFLVALGAMRQAERDEREASKKALDDEEDNRKHKLFEKREREGSICPKCGSKGRLVDKPAQPEAYMSNFWTMRDIPRHWWLSWSCSREPQISCGFRWRTYPDLPADDPLNAPEAKA
jgi:hypothetical protein